MAEYYDAEIAALRAMVQECEGKLEERLLKVEITVICIVFMIVVFAVMVF